MQYTNTRYLTQITLTLVLLITISCSDSTTDKRSQLFYAYQLCSPALSTDNADTLFLRAYNNFSVTTNDPTVENLISHECNIECTTAKTSAFVRQLFTLNEMPTDNIMCAWDDSGVADICLNKHDKTKPNIKIVEGMYLRLMCGIILCNKYLNLYPRENNQKLAEIRFLRALNYYYLLDLFGKAPIFKVFTNDISKVATSEDLYDFIEDELLDIIPFLMEGKLVSDYDAEYGHANQIAAHMLLARLYLNAKIYTGKEQWEKAAHEATTVINGPYKLSSTPLTNHSMGTTFSGYQLLFTADNGSNGANSEIIFPIQFDSKSRSDMGGTTYLICSTSKFDTKYLPNINGLGLKEQWIGNRARANLVLKFLPDSVPNEAYHTTMIEWAQDDRALFNSVDRRLSARKRPVFEDGFSIMKFTNFYASRPITSNVESMSSSDFPLMRLAEAYLTLAEAQWRMGHTEEALKNINVIRNRAHAKEMTSIDTDGYSILDEWTREFYGEGRRRTDLIRFNCFGGDNDYIWQWKGGRILGRRFDIALNNYALPIDSLIGKADKESKTYMYYLIGDGIGDNSWSTEGGDNIGKGIVPMSKIDETKLQFTDWLPANVGFKMFRDFDSWEEQFGAGEYPGEVAHNSVGSKHFTVSQEGINRVTLIPSESRVSVIPVASTDIPSYDMLILWVNHGKKEMKRYSSNPNTHVWRTDFECEGGEIMLNITKTINPTKEPLDLSKCLRFGIESSINNKGHILLHTEPIKQRIRVIYNDIDNSLYSYKLDDTYSVEDEIPQDINLELLIDQSYKSDDNAYALRHSFRLPDKAVVKKLMIGITNNSSNDFGTEICTIDCNNNYHEGTTIIYQDLIQKAIEHIMSANAYKFSIRVEFSLYGDTWSATNYSSTVYE